MSFDNEPKPTTPRDITAPTLDSSINPATLNAEQMQQRLVDQQWRNVVADGVNKHYPDSLNADSP